MPKETLRLVEHYTSVQGEGPRTGQLTQFIRFAGCNMRCPLWPCDTQQAIEPSIYLAKGGSYKQKPEELVNAIQMVYNQTGAENICFTGGEPFMQSNQLLQEVVEMIVGHLPAPECFSNGSFPYPDWAIQDIDFIMDWKLKGSGEADTKRDIRVNNALRLKMTDAIKFVVASWDDLVEAKLLWDGWQETESIKAQIWVGAAWGKFEDSDLVEFIKRNKLPWKLNVQVHKYIWDPNKTGV